MTLKQEIAFRLLWSQEVEELLFGGGAGGGKSWFLCMYGLLMCIAYPGIRVGLGREELKELKQTTLLTLFGIFASMDMQAGRDFRYDSIQGVIYINKVDSAIYLRELKYRPADPEYDSLGSTEYTLFLIDEAQQTNRKAYDVIKTRLRYKTMEYGIKGQLVMAGNPGKNFLYTDFFDAHRKGRLTPDKAFIQALVSDNPYIDPNYIRKLERSPEPIRQRLLFGNWDYENTDKQLVLRPWLDLIFTDEYPMSTEDRRVGVDIAREGADQTVIALWVNNCLADLRLVEVPITDQTDISGAIANAIIQFCTQHGVGYKDVYIDAVGVGGGVVDALRRQKWLVNSYKGGAAVNVKEMKEEYTDYKNLRAYSYWKLRQGVQDRSIKIYSKIQYLEELIRDLTVHEYEINEKMIVLQEKDQIKMSLGRSPDFSDAAVIGYAPAPKKTFSFAFS